MSLFDYFLNRKSLNNPSVPLTSKNVVAGLFGPTLGDFNVTEAGAMQLSSVYACVRVIAESVASLPLQIYREYPDGTKEKAKDLPAYQLIHTKPNPLQNAFEFWDTVVSLLLLRGNAFVFILKNESNSPTGLFILENQYIKVNFENGVKWYTYKENWTIADSEMLHFKGLSFDGLIGKSVIEYARNAIYHGLSIEEAGTKFFSQGSMPAGSLSVPGTLDDASTQRLRDSWNAVYQGSANSHKVAILEEGVAFTPIQINNRDAEYIANRKYSKTDIAGMFRVPPHLIGDLDRATFSNIEHQSLEFVRNTLTPWAKRIEQEISSKLMPALRSENEEYCAEFLFDSILRADTQTRYAVYAIALNNRIMNVNEVRAKENLNPVPGGDIFLTPLNMTSNPGGSGPTTGPKDPPVDPVDPQDPTDPPADPAPTA